MIVYIYIYVCFQLPVVMRIPQFSALAQNLCMMQFSILGYGDIIIPGQRFMSITQHKHDLTDWD